MYLALGSISISSAGQCMAVTYQIYAFVIYKVTGETNIEFEPQSTDE
jgi:hypothetical protein